MAAKRRPRGALNIDRKRTTSVVGRANAMCVGLDNHQGTFPNPSPPTSAIKAQVGVVNQAEITAASRAKGTASARDVERNILVGMLEDGLHYIQGVADQAPTWDKAVAILEAGGLPVAATGTRTKGILVVRHGPTSGSVVLDANVRALTAGLRGKVSYNWQYTLDGKTYVTLPSTPTHKTTVQNLTPVTSVGFRVSVTGASGTAGDWSQTVSFIVH
jgi:hypothetical protein